MDMPTRKIKGISVQLVRGDITLLDVQAFVYYAQPSLKLGSGQGNAIARRGGPGVQKELDQIGPRQTCEAVVTSAGDLKAKYIIHAVGPRFQEPDLETKLKSTVVAVLKLADEKGIDSLALPAMGCGFYGVPLDTSARVTCNAISDYLAGKTSRVRTVTICLTDHREVPVFERALAAVN